MYRSIVHPRWGSVQKVHVGLGNGVHAGQRIARELMGGGGGSWIKERSTRAQGIVKGRTASLCGTEKGSP
jgi:hypothetical protein